MGSGDIVLPTGELRAGADGDRHRATLDAAVAKGEDSWARQERERLDEERRQREQLDEERRYVAALDAQSQAVFSQAKSDALVSGGVTAVGGMAGLLLFGPPGAIVGVLGSWLYNSMRGE